METFYTILWVTISAVFVFLAAIRIGTYIDSQTDEEGFDDIERIKQVMEETNKHE